MAFPPLFPRNTENTPISDFWYIRIKGSVFVARVDINGTKLSPLHKETYNKPLVNIEAEVESFKSDFDRIDRVYVIFGGVVEIWNIYISRADKIEDSKIQFRKTSEYKIQGVQNFEISSLGKPVLVMKSKRTHLSLVTTK